MNLKLLQKEQFKKHQKQLIINLVIKITDKIKKASNTSTVSGLNLNFKL